MSGWYRFLKVVAAVDSHAQCPRWHRLLLGHEDLQKRASDLAQRDDVMDTGWAIHGYNNHLRPQCNAQLALSGNVCVSTDVHVHVPMSTRVRVSVRMGVGVVVDMVCPRHTYTGTALINKLNQLRGQIQQSAAFRVVPDHKQHASVLPHAAERKLRDI